MRGRRRGYLRLRLASAALRSARFLGGLLWDLPGFLPSAADFSAAGAGLPRCSCAALPPDVLPGRLPEGDLVRGGPLRFCFGGGVLPSSSAISSCWPATQTVFRWLSAPWDRLAGRSTWLNSSWISIRPIWRELKPASLAMAPTILPGFAPCALPTETR